MFAPKNEGIATYGLNSYTAKLLAVNLGWDKKNYGDGNYIIPSAQQPELLDTGRPFLVYGSAIMPASHLYVLREESVAYNIYAKTSTEVNKIVSLLSETFARQDDAAHDVNEWLAAEAAGRGYSREVSFTTIRASLSEKAEPADTEAGYVSGYILLETQYITGDTNIQTSGFTYP